MSTTRSLAAVAASTILTAALAMGVALPAHAGPINPIPGPVQPGPAVPSLPPGYTPPLFTIPACSTMVPANAITATQRTVPGFGPIPNTSGSYGAANSALVSVIAAHPDARTCTFGVGTSAQVIVTETPITSAEYQVLKGWYDRNSSSVSMGGTATTVGGRTDSTYSIGSTRPAAEVATLSPNGWWVTVRDAGRIGALPYFETSAAGQFLALNPRLALISR